MELFEVRASILEFHLQERVNLLTTMQITDRKSDLTNQALNADPHKINIKQLNSIPGI